MDWKLILKSAFKAICVWLICLLTYFVFLLFTHIQVPILSAIFGVNVRQNFTDGYTLTMSGTYPVIYICLGVFILMWVVASYINHKFW
ncbi:hypothetical protein GCM10022297_15040 [Lactobacillus hamsteri]|uniref:hypothetical protein n=1 Tax=Lactobacillus hamsteri TaxID=96565 RepID=UPI000468ADB0|nr:hypothetical protein [Lactobacillus hamsteri]